MWLQVLLFFLYTGTEVAAGNWAYSLLTESRGIPAVTAGVWVSLFWGSLTVSRVLAGAVAGRGVAHRHDGAMEHDLRRRGGGADLVEPGTNRELSWLGDAGRRVR